MSGPFSAKALRRVTGALDRHGVAYMVCGKLAAILQGFPDTTQDIDIFPRPVPGNAERLIRALGELGFNLTSQDRQDILGGKDFIQFPNAPIPLDIVHAPDGIESFEDAWRRGRKAGGVPVLALEDVLASKKAANRAKDRVVIMLLEPFVRSVRSRVPWNTDPLEPLEPERDRLERSIERRKDPGTSGR